MLHLKDDHYAFCIDLHYKLYPAYDLVERSVVLKNEMKSPSRSSNLHSAQFHIPYENLNFSNVHGHWGAEEQAFHQKVNYGKILIENRRGTSSHNHNPYFILDRDATETTGEVFFGALRMSGNFSGVWNRPPTGRRWSRWASTPTTVFCSWLRGRACAPRPSCVAIRPRL